MRSSNPACSADYFAIVRAAAGSGIARRERRRLSIEGSPDSRSIAGVGDGAEQRRRLDEAGVELQRFLQRRDRRVVAAERIRRQPAPKAESARGLRSMASRNNTAARRHRLDERVHAGRRKLLPERGARPHRGTSRREQASEQPRMAVELSCRRRGKDRRGTQPVSSREAVLVSPQSLRCGRGARFMRSPALMKGCRFGTSPLPVNPRRAVTGRRQRPAQRHQLAATATETIRPRPRGRS